MRSEQLSDFPNYRLYEDGRVQHIKSGRIRKNSISKRGYYTVTLYNSGKRKTLNIHRLLAEYFMENFNNSLSVDHIDGNKLNNDLHNLRMCTHQQNLMNTKLGKNNSSGYKGVSYCKDRKKFVSSIKHNYKTIFLGRYETAKEASEVYEKKAKELFGKYRRKG